MAKHMRYVANDCRAVTSNSLNSIPYLANLSLKETSILQICIGSEAGAIVYILVERNKKIRQIW